MATLDRYLRSVMRRCRKNFPDDGILIVTVEEPPGDEDCPDITYMTNMEPDEVAEIVGCLTAPSEPANDETGRAGETLH